MNIGTPCEACPIYIYILGHAVQHVPCIMGHPIKNVLCILGHPVWNIYLFSAYIRCYGLDEKDYLKIRCRTLLLALINFKIGDFFFTSGGGLLG